MKLDVNELTHAEMLVMESQAKYLLSDKKDVARFGLLFPKIDPHVVEKYSLIQAEDILPHFTERILSISDFFLVFNMFLITTFYR